MLKTVNFFQAFEDRYLNKNEENDLEVFSIKKNLTKELVVEIVKKEETEDIFNSLQNINQIVLSDYSIDKIENSLDEYLDLKEKLKTKKNIKTLDISFNLINDWLDIIKLVNYFPFIEELNITSNQINEIKLIDFNLQKKIFSNIKVLIVGNIKINWHEIAKINSLFINLENLNLFNNGLSFIDDKDDFFSKKLKFLSLSCNNIGWLNIKKLSKLIVLEHLQVDNCNIDSLSLNDDDFINLNRLNLNNNKLLSWSNISELAKLKNLKELSIKNNPIYKEQDYEKVFNFIIAILKNLQLLDNQIITSDMRKEAEIYFIRINYKLWINRNLTEWNVEDRFKELIDFYGKPTDLLKDVQINKFLNINIIDDNQKCFKKKILKTMDIYTLKILAKKLFSLNSETNFDFWCLKNDEKSLDFKLDKESKEIDFYPINDNCILKIVIN